MAKCSVCGRPAVYVNPVNGKAYCRVHFIEYFEKKVKKTIRKYEMLGEREHIIVAVSGGKDSMALLHFLRKLSRKIPGWRITAVLVDEGISGYREKTIRNLAKYAEENGVEYRVASFKEYIGATLDEIVEKGRSRGLPYLPCSYCGVFRRYVLNKAARELGGTVIATAHNMDDVVQTFIMNLASNSVDKIYRLTPVTGNGEGGFIRRVKPFYMVLEKESALYALLNNLVEPEYVQCPYAHYNIRFTIRRMINELEDKYPGVKYGLVNSLLSLTRDRQPSSTRGYICEICGEPSSHRVCRACLYRFETGLMSDVEAARVIKLLGEDPELRRLVHLGEKPSG
ncbi:TIGR00269 family protein [Desulfurococcus mucosus]|uniref:PP-loop domain protein n=1 Tax=Desulfurococcus mucosus (strain ATCC 35584 / DSM 2162 / JCM 9187 / O7/1) TaxID=765177 RepID=E8R8V3_DESM0|nr:TIGR00269 family protein [Desulfurococcus mucosus]ADV64929.1 PP-loop domain protein [Desulfurococcus mucosus DSM 2162]